MKIEHQSEQKYDVNPFNHTSVMETNCILKCLVAIVGGYGLGMVTSLFLNAVEYRELDFTKGAKQTTKQNMKKDIRKMKQMSRGFSVFGFYYTIWECQMEKMRGRDDGWNLMIAGMLTSQVLVVGSVGTKGIIMAGMGGLSMGWVFYKMNYLFTGRS